MSSSSSGWVERETLEGIPYYENTKTGETTWEKPESLQTSNDQELGGEWVWKPHELEGYVPAKLMESHPGVSVVQTEDGTVHEIKTKNATLIPLSRRNLRKHWDDLVQMDAIDEGMIAHNLRERFKKDIIYTSIGTILIVVNPFKWLPLYTQEIKQQYYTKGFNNLPPHIYDIADAALKDMIEGGTGAHKANQCILISGESGAGKTEATKQVLDYLAKVAGSVGNVEDKILVANPVLEAFGNAKTIRNDNSSRFGKWVEIFFDSRWRIVGGRVTNYLLEKVRLVRQATGERNYHIFYMLAKGATPEQRKRWRITRAEDYASLMYGNTTTADTINDEENWHEMLEAMNTLGFSAEEQDNVLQVVAGVMHFGNLRFVAHKEGSRVENRDTLAIAAELFGLDPAQLEKTITVRTMRPSAREIVEVPLNAEKAANNRDALIKSLYGNMFQWLVGKINDFIAPPGQLNNLMFIGVLDIFGFEIFEKNSFEQLCINFTNEKLQQHFNRHTFKLEEALYQSEQIDFTHVEFIDNQPCLDLIETKGTGILAALDEEGIVPRGSDGGFLEKIRTRFNGKHERYAHPVKIPNSFTVRHYAGEVVYDVANFIEKNRDTIEEDLLLLVRASTHDFLRSLFPDLSTHSRKATLGTQFKGQLNDLMTILNSTAPHYVRCIKPNSLKRSGRFDGLMSLLQLRYSGVFEAVRIRQSGYPFRYPHTEFVQRYQCLTSVRSRKIKDERAKIKAILEDVRGDWSEIKIGITRVLYRAASHRNLELRRSEKVWKLVQLIQAYYRGHRARVLFKRMKEVDDILKEAIRSRNLDQLNAVLEKCKGIWFQLRSMTDATRLRDRIVEEIKVAKLLDDLQADARRDPERHYEQIMSVLRRAEAINMQTPAVDVIRLAVQSIRERKETMSNLKLGIDLFDRALLEVAIPKAEQLGIGAEEVIRAREALVVIRREEAVSIRLRGCIDDESHTMRDLESTLEEAERMKLRSEAAKTAQKAGQATLTVRKALEARDWVGLQAAVDATGALAVNQAEMKAMRDGLTLRAKMTAVADLITRAMATVDADALRAHVTDGEAKGMSTSRWSTWADLMRTAHEFVRKYDEIITGLKHGLSVDTPAHTVALKTALVEAVHFGLRLPRDLTLQISASVIFDLRTALHRRNWEALAKAVKAAEDLGVDSREADKAREGLMLRAQMTVVADRLAAAEVARDGPLMGTLLDEAARLDMARSFWSTWQAAVAQAALTASTMAALLHAVTTSMAPRRTEGAVRAAVDGAEEFGFKLPQDLALLAVARILADLRAARIAKDWAAMALLLMRAREANFVHEEVQETDNGLALRTRMEMVAGQLAEAVAVRDAVALGGYLTQARSLDMAGSYWSTWQANVVAADECLARHRHITNRLEEGMKEDSPDTEVMLQGALEDAVAFAFRTPRDTALVARSETLLALRVARHARDWPGLEVAARRATEVGLVSIEVHEIKSGLLLRARMEGVADRMETAIERRDSYLLKLLLNEAQELDMRESFWSTWSSAVHEAALCLRRHNTLMSGFEKAFSADTSQNEVLLASCLEEAAAFELTTEHDLAVVARGQVLLDLRRALHARQWADIATAVETATRMEFELPEVEAAREGLALRARMGVLADQIVAGVKGRDAPGLADALQKARDLGLATSWWSTWAPVVIEATDHLERHTEIMRRLNDGLNSTGPAHEALLKRALAEASAFGVITPQDLAAVARGQAVADMRRGQAEKDWRLVELGLNKALQLGVASPEVAAVRVGMAQRLEMEDVARRLTEAMEGARDGPATAAIIVEADRLKMSESPFSSWVELVAEAREFVKKHEEILLDLRRGGAADTPEHTKMLLRGVAEGNRLVLRTPNDMRLLEVCNRLVEIRAGLRDGDWAAVEQAVFKTVQAGIAIRETEAARVGMELRARMQLVAERLTRGIEERDKDTLVQAVAAGLELEMGSSPWSSWSTLIDEGQKTLQRHLRILAELAQGMADKESTGVATLRWALADARRHNYKVPADVSVVQQATAILGIREGILNRDFAAITKHVADGEQLGLSGHPDMTAAEQGLETRAQMNALATRLTAALEARDTESVTLGAVESASLEMGTSPWSSWHKLALQVEEAVRGQKRLMARLQLGIDANTPHGTSALRSALMEARQMFFTGLMESRTVQAAEATLAVRTAISERNWQALATAMRSPGAAGMNVDELHAARRGIAVRALMDKTFKQIKEGLASGDADLLRAALDVTRQLDTGHNEWSDHAAEVVAADTFIRRHDRVHAMLTAGLASSSSRATASLNTALKSTSLPPESVMMMPADRRLLETARVTSVVRAALASRDTVALRNAATLARERSMSSSEVDTVNKLLAAMTRAKTLELDLERATTRRDVPALQNGLIEAEEPELAELLNDVRTQSVLRAARNCLNTVCELITQLEVGLETPLDSGLARLSAILPRADEFGVGEGALMLLRKCHAAHALRLALANHDSGAAARAVEAAAVVGITDGADIDEARRVAGLRRSMAAAATALEEAMRARDMAALDAAIDAADAVDLGSSPWSSWVDLTARATSLASRLHDLELRVVAATRSASNAATADLTRALTEADVLGVTSTPTLELARRVLALREALAARDWKLLAKLSEGVPRDDDPPELAETRRGLASRQQMATVVARIRPALELMDEAALSAVLNDARALDVGTSVWSSWVDDIQSAERVLADLQHMQQLFDESMQSLDENTLIAAVRAAELLHYPDSNEDFRSVRRTRDQVLWLHAAAEEALALGWPELLRKVVERASMIGLSAPAITQARAMYEDLVAGERSLPGNELVAPLFFTQYDGTPFHLSRYSNLRTVAEFGEAARGLLGGGREAAERSMYEYTTVKIPTSLVRTLGPNEIPMALQFFTHLTAHMEGKVDLVPRMPSIGSLSEYMRDEVYCQIIKMLTNNPSDSSNARGWILMECATQAFLPSNDLYTYLEWFLRQYAPKERVMDMLRALQYNVYLKKKNRTSS